MNIPNPKSSDHKIVGDTGVSGVTSRTILGVLSRKQDELLYKRNKDVNFLDHQALRDLSQWLQEQGCDIVIQNSFFHVDEKRRLLVITQELRKHLSSYLKKDFFIDLLFEYQGTPESPWSIKG